jgi:hypothetical protein
MMYWFDHPDGGLIFAVADGGWWKQYDDEGQLDPPVTAPDGLFKPISGFGKIWYVYGGLGHDILRERLGWAEAPEESGQGECWETEKGWNLWFGDPADVVKLITLPSPPPPPVGPPPPSAVPPPFAGWSRAPELVVLGPSGKMRDLAFCTGATPMEDGTLRVTWAYGYYITVNRETGEITLRGETVEVLSGDDAVAFTLAWHLRQGHIKTDA